jgi:hypothetical protein
MTTGRSQARFLVYDSARPLRLRRLIQPLPSGLQSAKSVARELELRIVDEHKIILQAADMALARVLAVDPERQFLCEIVGGFPADAPVPAWQCVTILEGGAGVLLTTTRHPMPLADGEIAQSLPGAEPGQLLASHRIALKELRSFGLDMVAVTDARGTSATAHHLLGQPARDDRSATARRLRANLNEHRDAAIGPIHTSPDLPARLALLRALSSRPSA